MAEESRVERLRLEDVLPEAPRGKVSPGAQPDPRSRARGRTSGRGPARLAREASVLWREHGALEYRECVGDDLAVKCGLPFPRGIRIRRGETVVFSWIVYRSRAHRDRVNAKIVKDPRIEAMCAKGMPFDMARMMCGGFRILVEA